MRGRAAPADGPAAAELAEVFDVDAVRADGDTLLYVGEARTDGDAVERHVWPLFRQHGYEVSLERDPEPPATDADVLVARPRDADTGVPWKNALLFVATVLSTLFAGAVYWYRVPVFSDPLSALAAWPFTVAILGVLGVHEFGHYAMSRYHDVDASLPYFIPLPTYIGSMGAVIRMRGRIPDRRALFDIGAAGPLAGLVATAVVTVVGLQLEPIAAAGSSPAPESAARIVFNDPPLLELLAALTGTTAKLDGSGVHPVVFGGWVGMFVTFLNLLPVGQLDGGHVLRALVGERQRTIAAAVPGVLFALAGYLLFVRDGVNSVGIWALWGVFAVGLAYAGPATPVRDHPLDRGRIALGIVTFALGALCFTPVPVEIVTP